MPGGSRDTQEALGTHASEAQGADGPRELPPGWTVPELCSLSGSLRKRGEGGRRALGISSRQRTTHLLGDAQTPGVLLDTGSQGPSAEPDVVALGTQGCLHEEQPR